MPRNIQYPGVFVEEIPSGVRSIPSRETDITAFLGFARRGPSDRPRGITSIAQFESLFGDIHEDFPLSLALRDFFENGGRIARVTRVRGSADDREASRRLLGLKRARSGLYALDRCDHFNVLCIPPLSPNRDPNKRILAAAAKYCEKRRAFLIIDPPRSWSDTAEAHSAMQDPMRSLGTGSANAAVFFPRLIRRGQVYAPCGAVAGVMARNDASRGVWKAPAGLEASISGGSSPAIPLNDSHLSLLNPLACNGIRRLEPQGTLIWGARTLEGRDAQASEWKYIPVRRTALYLEDCLQRGLSWVVFEPNDEALWANIRSSVGTFMYEMFRRGAFQGQKADHAYFVKCDSETTTPGDINRGILNLHVGFAPLKPAEFVVIKLSFKIAN